MDRLKTQQNGFVKIGYSIPKSIYCIEIPWWFIVIFPIKLCPKSSHFQAHPQIKIFSYHIPMKSMFLSLWFLVTFMKPISESSGLSSTIFGVYLNSLYLIFRHILIIVFPIIPPMKYHEILSYPHVCCFNPHKIPMKSSVDHLDPPAGLQQHSHGPFQCHHCAPWMHRGVICGAPWISDVPSSYCCVLRREWMCCWGLLGWLLYIDDNGSYPKIPC